MQIRGIKRIVESLEFKGERVFERSNNRAIELLSNRLLENNYALCIMNYALSNVSRARQMGSPATTISAMMAVGDSVT